MYYPYSDSPELRRVAKAQEALSDVGLILPNAEHYCHQEGYYHQIHIHHCTTKCTSQFIYTILSCIPQYPDSKSEYVIISQSMFWCMGAKCYTYRGDCLKG